MKTVLKALAVIVCAVLLAWNAAQLKAIEKGTHEVAVEYGTYAADDAVGEYREAKILGLIPFAVEEKQQKYGSAVIDTQTAAYYCMAILEDYSIGAVKLVAINEQLAGYEEWVIESEKDYSTVLQSEGFTIRGKTTTMPHFNSDILTAIKEDSFDPDTTWKEAQKINQSFEGITLLDTIGNYSDTEIVVPDLPTLNGKENFVIVALVVAALLLTSDLLKIFTKKAR